MTNPFELFGLPETFRISADDLRTAYLRAIKAHHPDKYLQDPVAHERALKTSADIHEAYQVLSKPLDLIGFMLRKKGVLDEKEALPQDFLFEMMDLNEQLDELEHARDEKILATLQLELQNWEAQLTEKLHQSIEKQEDGGEGNLIPIKDSYLKMKYILRLKERMVNFASR